MTTTTAKTQPGRESITLYLGRVGSRRLTPLFLRLRVSANWATAIWGLLSIANSYLIYVALSQGWWLLSVPVFAVYYVALVIDCVDGEIARARGTASPIGGKLLDGIWHKATEYSLLVSYAFAATGSRWGGWALPIGLVLMVGEAMHTYAYERRLLVIRVHAQSKESISGVTSDEMYRREERWCDFSAKRKMNALLGLVQYKSVYFMIAMAAVSRDALFVGVVILAVYKHYDWIALITRTVRNPPRLSSN